jgi:hypothetical protein
VEEPVPQRHGVGQVDVHPVRGAVVQALGPGVEPRADLDHRAAWMGVQPPLHPQVQQPGPQH